MTLGPFTGGSRRSPKAQRLSCKLEKQLPVCMMTGTPLLVPITFKCPVERVPLGAGRFGVFQFSCCEVGESAGGRLPRSPTHPLHACPVLFVFGGLGPDPSAAHLADSSSFSPQTQVPPCLQIPRPRAQAQSPLCHLRSEEPARHLSLSPPMEIKFPGTALSPPLGPFPSLESSSLRKESSSCPSKAPTMPGRGVHFYIGLFKDFCLKDISNVWERG